MRFWALILCLILWQWTGNVLAQSNTSFDSIAPAMPSVDQALQIDEFIPYKGRNEKELRVAHKRAVEALNKQYQEALASKHYPLPELIERRKHLQIVLLMHLGEQIAQSKKRVNKTKESANKGT